MKILVILYVLCLLSGCGEPEKRTDLTTTPATQAGDRFTVTRVALFSDGLAYSGQRGIYIIRDVDTGIEYLGVSGIGISEIGSHRAAKSTIRDER